MLAGSLFAERFDVERRAGAGGMSDVMRARDRVSGAWVALKMMGVVRGDAERLAREALTTAEAVDLACRVAEALGAAHARGIVHRDVEPSNRFLVGGSVARVRPIDRLTLAGVP